MGAPGHPIHPPAPEAGGAGAVQLVTEREGRLALEMPGLLNHQHHRKAHSDRTKRRIAMASNLRAMASNQIAMASNL